MKSQLDFKFTYNCLEGLNYIQRFATAYTYLETSTDTNGDITHPDIKGYCAGCRADCSKDETATIRCKFFFMFNTMSGNSSIRGHFDGTPTEAQKLVGDTVDEDHGCGSDYMVDFLFGYTGYDYRKCTDAAAFKDEIIKAIDAGKPVIAKVKSGYPRFYLINGYDGNALICPEFNIDWDFVKIKPEESRPDGPPSYDELDVLYIFGDKTTRRYTIKDGLNNIRRTMECNIREHVLDDYLPKFGGCDPFRSDDGAVIVNPEEQAALAARLHEIVLYIFNIVSFFGAFANDGEPHSHYLHKELWDKDIAELTNRLNEQHWIIVGAGHKINELSSKYELAGTENEIIHPLNVGVWPMPDGQYDPTLKGTEIPNGAQLYGLFDDNYNKYSPPGIIEGLVQVESVTELKPGCFCVINASSGFSYVVVLTDKPEDAIFSLVKPGLSELNAEIYDELSKIIEADLKLLDLINQLIEILVTR